MKIETIMQAFLATDAVPANALRNQGVGIPQRIQGCLQRINLASLRDATPKQYADWLNEQTLCVLEQLPLNHRPWGTARKAINMFVRACICNHYLRQEFDLENVEPFAEIPLDSIVAQAMKRHAGWGQLPQWPGLKHLNAEANTMFQDVANQWAQDLGICHRVYLDNFLWIKERKASRPT